MDKKVIIVLAVAAVVVVGAVAAAIVLSRGSEGGTVYYITLAPKDMKSALAANQIDAYIAWEPYVSDSVAGEVGEVLVWSDEIMSNHPCCIVAVRNDFASGTNGQDLTKRFVKAHVEATQWMLDALADKDGENYSLLVDMATQFTARNATVVEAAFEHVVFGYTMGSSFKSSLEEFTEMYIDTNLTDVDALAAREYSSVEDFVDTYADTTYLDSLSSVAPSDTILNPTAPVRLGFLAGDIHQMAQVVAQSKAANDGVKSMLEKYGVKVENATGAPFASGGYVMTAFAAGNVDIGYLGAPPAILQHLNLGVDVSIVSQANSEGSGVVVKAGSDIHNLRGLENKTVATPGESSIQFLLLKIALEREGLDLKIKT